MANPYDWRNDAIVDQPLSLPERKTGADIDQSGASAEGSRASAAKAREEIITERQTRPFQTRKIIAEASASEANAAKADQERKDLEEKAKAAKDEAARELRNVLDRVKQVRADATDGYNGLFETGLSGSLLRGVKGTAAYALAKNIGTIEANNALGKLMQMKALSPTGASGLGSTSLPELEMLKSSVASLDPSLDQDTFLKNLDVVEKNYLDMLRRVDPEGAAKYGDATAGSEDGQAGDTPQGEKVQSWRLSPEAVATIRDYIQSPGFTPEGYTRLVAAKALEEGHVKPEEMGAFYQRNLTEAQNFFGKFHSDEERIKGTGPGFDYSKADEQAREQAGLGTNLLQTAKNIPESGAALLQGIVALPADAIASAVSGERVGSFKGVTDLAAELIRMGGGQPEGPTVKALGDMIEQRYGGWDNIKNTMVTDPVGFAGDLSLVLAGGGGAAAKVGEVANMSKLAKVGGGIRVAGRAIDPLSLGVAGVSTAKDVVPDVVKALPGKAAAGTLGLTTGAGGEGFARAAGVGFERGQKGPTARSDAFLDQMRGGDPEAAIEQAKTAVAAIRQEASDRYRSGMVDISKDKTQLDFGDIDNALLRLSRIGNYKGAEINSAAQKAYAEVRNVIDEWRAKDPAEFHTPEGMDALKQKIWDVAGNLAEGGDRRAAKVVKGLYQSVKQTINKQAPAYASVMKDYERASEKLNNITKTFSLNPNASVDTQLRKLQSVLRNNANTNYGYRRDLAGLMEQYGGPEMVDALSAHSLNSWTPRGLQRLAAGTAATSGAAGLIPGAAGATALANPANLAMLPLMSPRMMGEASYYAGAGAGKASLGLEKLAQAYNAHPTATLALAAGGEHSSDLEDLAARYGLGDTDFLTKTVYGGQ